MLLAYNPRIWGAEAGGYQEFMITTQQVSSRATEIGPASNKSQHSYGETTGRGEHLPKPMGT